MAKSLEIKRMDLQESVRVLSEEKIKLESEIQKLYNVSKEVIDYILLQKNELDNKKDLLDSKRKDIDDSNLTSGYMRMHIESEKQKLIQQEKDVNIRIDNELKKSNRLLEDNNKRIEELYYQEKELELNLEDIEYDILVASTQLRDIQYSIIEQSRNQQYQEEHTKDLIQSNIRMKEDGLSQIKDLQDQVNASRRELETITSTSRSIRQELINKEKELDERETNLQILIQRYRKQMRAYFPHISNNI